MAAQNPSLVGLRYAYHRAVRNLVGYTAFGVTLFTGSIILCLLWQTGTVILTACAVIAAAAFSFTLLYYGFRLSLLHRRFFRQVCKRTICEQTQVRDKLKVSIQLAASGSSLDDDNMRRIADWLSEASDYSSKEGHPQVATAIREFMRARDYKTNLIADLHRIAHLHSAEERKRLDGALRLWSKWG